VVAEDILHNYIQIDVISDKQITNKEVRPEGNTK
jgi:hypothetical protein